MDRRPHAAPSSGLIGWRPSPALAAALLALILLGLTLGGLLHERRWLYAGGALVVLAAVLALHSARRGKSRSQGPRSSRPAAPGRWERLRLYRLRRKYKVIPGGLDRRRA